MAPEFYHIKIEDDECKRLKEQADDIGLSKQEVVEIHVRIGICKEQKQLVRDLNEMSENHEEN